MVSIIDILSGSSSSSSNDESSSSDSEMSDSQYSNDKLKIIDSEEDSTTSDEDPRKKSMPFKIISTVLEKSSFYDVSPADDKLDIISNSSDSSFSSEVEKEKILTKHSTKDFAENIRQCKNDDNKSRQKRKVVEDSIDELCPYLHDNEDDKENVAGHIPISKVNNKINDSKYLSSNDGNITLLSNEDENGEKDEEDDSFKSHDLDNCKETDNVYFDDQASHSHRYKDVGMNEIEKNYSKKLEMNSAKEDIQNTQNNRSRIQINNYEKACYTNASMKGSNQNSNNKEQYRKTHQVIEKVQNSYVNSTSTFNNNNVCVAEGVTFSSASTLFFSSTADGKTSNDSIDTNKGEPKGRSGVKLGIQSNRSSSAIPLCPIQTKNSLQGSKLSKPIENMNKFTNNSLQSNSVYQSPSTKSEFKLLDKQKEVPLINPSSYKPPPYQDKPDPIVHELTLQNRPSSKRYMIPVSKIFCSPVSNFWSSNFHSFNYVQSELSQLLSQSDDNVCVSAPTGAGKTCVFEMAMGRLFIAALNNRKQCHQHHGISSKISKNQKIVYISPSKALCDERYKDWTRRLAAIDSSIDCALVTGDSGSDSFRVVASAHVILTTPEKWDSITRKWTNHLFLIGSVKLLLIDEVHLLGDKDRGPCLEAIICRMKTVQRATRAKLKDLGDSQLSRSEHIAPASSWTKMRIIAVSATLPNIMDIASFLDAHEAYVFDQSYRPVILTTHVVGLGYIGKNRYLFDKGLNKHVPSLLKRFSSHKPSIVFCHSKKETENLALELSAGSFCENNIELENLAKTNNTSLNRCLKRGVAFHHAGIDFCNREVIESAFKKGLIKCLCATSTLACGVNLPAHLVIIKGTSCWRGSGNGYQDIDSGTLLQMMGRAGRPGYDTSGTAVIMTDSKSQSRYEKVSTGLEVVESNLLEKLIETLNTEISQYVIVSVEQAIDWIKGTFFFQRVRKNPRYYGIQGKSKPDIDNYITTKCMSCLEDLHKLEIISLTKFGEVISPKKASHVMSQHMVPFQSMKLIIELPFNADCRSILEMLSNMEGIHYPVRKFEKSLLNKACKLMKYKLEGPPSKVRIQTASQKAFVLLQAAIGQHYLEDFTLRQEMSLTVDMASRMLEAVESYSVEESKHGKVALESLLLRRCIATSLWGPGNGVLNQLRGVGQKTAAKLTMNKICTFADIMSCSSNEIEQACGRNSSFGQELKTAVSKILFNSLSLSAQLEMATEKKRHILICDLSYREKLTPSSLSKIENGVVTYTLSVHTDRPRGSLMFRKNLSNAEKHQIVCPKDFGRLYIRLVSNLIGLDEQLMINGNGKLEISPFKVSPKTKNLKKSEGNESFHEKWIKEKIIIKDTIEIKRVQKNVSIKDVVCKISNKKQKINSPATTSMKRYTDKYQQPKKSETNDLSCFVTPSPPPTVTITKPNIRSISPVGDSMCFTKNSIASTKATYDYSIRNEKDNNNRASLWNKEKINQKSFQKRAFCSPNANPFSSFKYDPNDAERVFEKESNTDVDINSVNMRFSNYSTKRSNNAANTPAKSSGIIHSIGSARRRRVGSASLRIPNRDLLHLKAKEQQSYSSALSQQFSNHQNSNISLPSKTMHYENPNKNISNHLTNYDLLDNQAIPYSHRRNLGGVLQFQREKINNQNYMQSPFSHQNILNNATPDSQRNSLPSHIYCNENLLMRENIKHSGYSDQIIMPREINRYAFPEDLSKQAHFDIPMQDFRSDPPPHFEPNDNGMNFLHTEKDYISNQKNKMIPNEKQIHLNQHQQYNAKSNDMFDEAFF